MKTASAMQIRETVAALLPAAQTLLCDMIRYPSTSGQEHELMLFLERHFAGRGLEVERRPMHDALRDDSGYSSPVEGIRYDGRFNLRLRRPGSGGGRTVMFNAHSDVVPPSPGQDQAFEPRVEDGAVHGRGACDDKGQIALLALTLATLDALDVRTGGDILAHVVCEEENGGNGSLAMTRAGERADACIVLEPTEGRLLTSIRGAVWFRLVFRGVAGHSGMAGKTVSALLKARDAIGILERYHAGLLAASRGFPLFDPYPNPMPITFGKLNAGNWPAAAPNTAVLEGVLGLLPNRTADQVCREMHAALVGGGLKGEWTVKASAAELPAEGDDFRLSFMYRHDSSVLDPEHELPRSLLASLRSCGQSPKVDAMTASCDACYYRNDLGIPVLVFGAGTLGVAHSIRENIRMADIAAAAEGLVHFIATYTQGV